MLETRKAELAAAIEEEKRRVIRQVARQTPGLLRLGVTSTMRRIISLLYDAGQRIARAELLLLGIEDVGRSFATPDSLQPRLGQLETHLGSISLRIQTEAAGVDMAGQSLASITREIDRLVPGALDAASRIVSGAFDSGMGDLLGQADRAGLISTWIYSAMMDANTCDVCDANDGHEYESWDAISVVLPNGGPNPECFGNGRCRCMAVPEGANQEGSVYPGEPLPSPETALEQALAGPTILRTGEIEALPRLGAYHDAYLDAFGSGSPEMDVVYSQIYPKLEKEIYDRTSWKADNARHEAGLAAERVTVDQVSVLRDSEGRMLGIVDYNPGYTKIELQDAYAQVEREIQLEALSPEEGNAMRAAVQKLADRAEQSKNVGVNHLASTGAQPGSGARLMQEVAKAAVERDKGVGLNSLDDASSAFYRRLGMTEDPDRPGNFYWTKAEAKRFAETGDASPPAPPPPKVVSTKGVERVDYWDSTYLTEGNARLAIQERAGKGVAGSRRAVEALNRIDRSEGTAYVVRNPSGNLKGAAAVRGMDERLVVEKYGATSKAEEEALLKRIAGDAIDSDRTLEIGPPLPATDQAKALEELGFKREPGRDGSTWKIDQDGLYKLAGREPPAPTARPFGHLKESSLKQHQYRGRKRLKELDHEIAEAVRDFDSATSSPEEAARIQRLLDEHKAMQERLADIDKELELRKAGTPSTREAPSITERPVREELPVPSDPRLAEIQRVYREKRDDPGGWQPEEWRNVGASGRIWGETEEGDAAMREVIRHGEQLEQVLAERIDQAEADLAEKVFRELHPGQTPTETRMRFIRSSSRFQRQWDTTRRQVILDTLREIRPFGGDVEFSGPADLKLLAERVRDELPSEWVQAGRLEGPYKVGQIERGHFNRWNREIMVSNRWSHLHGDDARHNVMRHEQGHMAESRVPQLVQLERAFYNSRTFGQDPVSLKKLKPGSNYESHEMAIPDDFIEVYMGKEYGDAYELLSMGLEMLLDASHGSVMTVSSVRASDAARSLFGRDPEFFRFILGLLSVA